MSTEILDPEVLNKLLASQSSDEEREKLMKMLVKTLLPLPTWSSLCAIFKQYSSDQHRVECVYILRAADKLPSLSGETKKSGMSGGHVDSLDKKKLLSIFDELSSGWGKAAVFLALMGYSLNYPIKFSGSDVDTILTAIGAHKFDMFKEILLHIAYDCLSASDVQTIFSHLKTIEHSDALTMLVDYGKLAQIKMEEYKLFCSLTTDEHVRSRLLALLVKEEKKEIIF